MNAPRCPSIVLPAAAVVLFLWSAMPLAIWWDGADPAYFAGAWATWGWGCLLVALVVLLLAALSKGRASALLLNGWRRTLAIPTVPFVAACTVLFAAAALLMCLLVFDGNPRNVDGFAQLFQARSFLAGRLWVPPPPELANFGTLQMVLGPERWYAQYPYGQSLVLAAGILAGAWWAANPLLAAVLAVATWRVARWACGESAARLALILLCLSPFAVAVAGSEMSHLGAAALGMSAAAAATEATTRRPLRYGALAGALLGLMTAFRPLDAVAAAVPVLLIIAGWAPQRMRALSATLAAGTVWSIPTLAYNALTTGSWRRFGYVELWGAEHSLGFHSVPFGTPLTLSRAIARSGLDLHQLNAYLLDTTIPVLLIVAGGFVAGRRQLQSRDAIPFAAVAALIAALFAYWHRDVFYGPRFLYSVVCWLLLMVARAVVLIRRSGPVPSDTGPGALALLVVAMALLFGLVTITPGRIRAYRQSTPLFALHPERDAERAGIHHAVVVIPDGWGSRLIARMWALGIPVRRSTRLYAGIDACTLEHALGAAEGDAGLRSRLPQMLDSLVATGRPGRRTGLTEDPNLRLLEGAPLSAACVSQIQFDRRGFYSYAPYLWLNSATLDGDIVWARDLLSGNGPLFSRYAGRRLYRYAPEGPGQGPAFLPLVPGSP